MVKGCVHTSYNVPFRPCKLFEDCVCGLSGLFVFLARPLYKVEQEEGVPDERSLLQYCLHEVSRFEVKDPKFKHEIFFSFN